MKITKPWFYDDFCCTAASCTDNCCIGWEIDIDKSAMERFSKAEGEFAERLRSAIHTEGECPAFALREGERCALLRDDGLCELILNMGEDSLCDICALHPRFFGWYNDIKESGLGLCCEEVCRLMFSSSERMSFISEEIEEPWEENCAEDIVFYLINVRKQLYRFMQDRNLSLGDRLYNSIQFTREAQTFFYEPDEECLAVNTSAGFDEILDDLLNLYKSAESINAEWDERLKLLIARKQEISDMFPEFLRKNFDDMWRYEHIAVYTCYRYFLSGALDIDFVSKIGMVCFMTLGVALLDCLKWLEKGKLTEWDRIVDLKLFSKQFEYSGDNIELVYDSVWENEHLAPESLAKFFIY